MHCSVTQLSNINLRSMQAQHKVHLFVKSISNGWCGERKKITLKNLILRSVLLGIFFFLSGKEAKRVNRSLVSYRVRQTTLLPTPPHSNYFDGEGSMKNVTSFQEHDPLQMPKKTKTYSSSAKQSENAILNPLNAPGIISTEANIMPKFQRQIVPLPKPKGTNRPYQAPPRRLSREMEKMVHLYKSFLVNYAFLNGWGIAKFLTLRYQFGHSLCQDFNDAVLLSKASLYLECSNEPSTSNRTNKTGSERKPFIIADFISDKEHNVTRQVINPHLLINYSPKRPILILAGNESVAEILERYQQITRNNYKWTLAKIGDEIDDKGDGQIIEGGEEGQIKIYDILGFASYTKILHQLIGTWSETGEFHFDELKRSGVYSFNGETLRITTISGPPMVFLQYSHDLAKPLGKRSVSAMGYLPDIFHLVSLVLNFTYVILTPEDGKFGDRNEDGNWSGMIGMLQRNEADIALMSISYTKSRKSIMDYSPPVEYSSTRLLIRRDWQPAELKWDAFIRPFEWKVWLTIFILIGIGTITLVIFANFKLFMATPGQSMWLLSTCFLLQGQSEHSTIRVTPFRIAVGSFWILAVFIFACYTARLTSFLAADTERTPVKDLREALRSALWGIGLVKGSSFQEKVKESKDEEMSMLWKRIQKNPSVLVDGISDGVSRVYKERYIFFTSELIPKFLVRGNCSYTWLPGKYFPGFGSLGYQKNLPYASGISHVITKLRESGLMRRTFKKWWGVSGTCNSRTGTDAFLAISLHEAGSAFLVLSIGAAVAILFTVIEYALWMRENDHDDEHGHDHELQNLPHTEFAAPIVHGTYKNILPTIFEEDRPFVWSTEHRENVLRYK